MSDSAQKFVARNRAPRVQIEYDVELYGAEKTVQLPFVMGVMSDLSGKSETPLPAVADRKFLEIDVDNFDDRMKAMAPRAAFVVPNTLTGEGNLSVDLTFEQMVDFSPAAIAKKVAPLRALLEARTQLAHLATYMDGKTGAEGLIAELMSDPASFAALTNTAQGDVVDHEAALEALRARAPGDTHPAADNTAQTLDQLRAMPVETAEVDETKAVLTTLRAAADDADMQEAAAEDAEDRDAILAKLAAETGTEDHVAPVDVESTDATLEDMSAQDAPEQNVADALTAPQDEDDSADFAALTQTFADEDQGDDLDAADLAFADMAEDVTDADETDEAPETDFADLLDAADEDTDDDMPAGLAETPVDAAEVEVDLADVTQDLLEADDAEKAPETDLADLLDAVDEDADDDMLGGLAETPADAVEADLDLSDVTQDLLEADDAEEAPETDLADLLDATDEDADEALTELSAAVEEDEAENIDADAGPAGDLEDAVHDAPETPIATPFGTLDSARPTDAQDTQQKFRIAIMGDFSGRGSRGALETGAALARRKPIKFDIDTLDDVIARFATTLVLPIGTDGAGVEVKLTELDDLHPDQLFENVEVFAELSALRQRAAMGDGAAAIAEMQGWAGEFGKFNLSSRKRAKGTTVPADRSLSAFQTLIGDMQGQLATPSPASDLIARIVGPYAQAAPDPAQPSMIAAIDEALSGAMRAILHHPDFQAVEATWRSLELLARRIETGAKLDVVLYDVSAEEWAADLSAQDDLAQSGLFQMLGEDPRLDATQGPLSAVFGLYTLEETPPHAELLARMAKIADWMNAPFLAAMSPKFLETPKHERHPLTAQTWDALGALPEAGYIGLAAPRFLLRLPYGAKTEPVDPFTFEEFTLREGLKGMLWANPVVLSAILMARTVNTHGNGSALGKILSLDDMPLHYMTDQYGDQIALPCTDRLLNTTTTAEVTARGFIPLLSMKGRPEVRQGAFQALSGTALTGPWAPRAASTPAENTAEVSMGAVSADATGEDASDDDGDTADIMAMLEGDGLSDLDGFDDADDDADGGGTDEDGDDDADAELAALLAGFEDGSDNDDTDDDDDDDDEDELDPELAALLEGL